MRAAKLVLCAGIVLLGAVGAQADLRMPMQNATLSTSACINSVSSILSKNDISEPYRCSLLTEQSGDCPTDFGLTDYWCIDTLSTGLVDELCPDVPAPSTENKSKQVVRELPPLPGSSSLFLSAMLSIGAWQLVRNARNVHLSDLPDWYHTAGPAQVGHAVPLDLQFAPLALCALDAPVGERPVIFRVGRELCSSRHAQCFLTITAPRGPPNFS